MNARKRSIIRYALAAILFAFGALTLFLSSAVILDLFGMRAKEGNYVDFVVWANLFASCAYLLAALGLLQKKPVGPRRNLLFATVVLLAAGIGFAFHVNGGGIHEQHTIGALVFRTSLTAVFFLIAYWLGKQKPASVVKAATETISSSREQRP